MKKVIYLSLAGLFVCGAFSACGKEERKAAETSTSDPIQTAKVWDYENPNQIVYDCLGGDGEVIPLLGFWGMPTEGMLDGQHYPSFKNEGYFADVAESGINLLLQANDNIRVNDLEVETTMDFCDQYDIGYIMTDKNIFNRAISTNEEQLFETTRKYAEAHKCFAGYYISDEPMPGSEESAMQSALKAHYNMSNRLGLNIHPYMNMFPSSVGPFKSDPWTLYDEYMQEMYEDTGADFLTYDIYCLYEDDKNGVRVDYENFYSNMSMVRKKAKELDTSWIAYVSVSSEQEYKLPTEGELAWQVNTYIAFGAKGMCYFPINSPLSFSDHVAGGETHEERTVAMFDFKGNKTKVYYFVQQVNNQLLAVDQYIMKATNHGVIFHGDMEGAEYFKYDDLIDEKEGFRELVTVEGDKAAVGCFDYYGKTCLYVVNGDMANDAAMTLRFDDRYAYEVIQRGQTANVQGSKINLSLAAGESALIVLK